MEDAAALSIVLSKSVVLLIFVGFVSRVGFSPKTPIVFLQHVKYQGCFKNKGKVRYQFVNGG